MVISPRIDDADESVVVMDADESLVVVESLVVSSEVEVTDRVSSTVLESEVDVD